jgi:hypothetical protein
MKYILEFEGWKYLKEKFNADIKDVDTKKDMNDIENTKFKDTIVVNDIENSEPIIYTIDGTTITAHQKQTSIDDNGNSTNTTDTVVKEITDDKLKLDIKKAAYAIRDVKDRLYAEEILRITGGDISDATDEIRGFLDTFQQSQTITFGKNNKPTPPVNFINNETKNRLTRPFSYIRLNGGNKWGGKYNLNYKTIIELYNQTSHTIGKGEYLLPILFNDIYKSKAYGENAKGDNYFTVGGNKYFIEVKTPGASLPFKTTHGGTVDYLERSIKAIKEFKNENNTLDIREFVFDIYKTAIAQSIIHYVCNQFDNKNNYIGGFLCLFEDEQTINNEKDSKTPIGMWFINVTSLKDYNISDMYKETFDPKTFNPYKKPYKSLLEKIKQKVYILNGESDYTTNGDFQFSYVGGYSGKINCILNFRYFKKMKELLAEEVILKPRGRPSKSEDNKPLI